MPKSKRNKQVELSKTKKRGLEWKKHLFEEVRSCVDSYTNVYVFSVNDMRNAKMKNVREQWKHSRFFIGKNKIMAMALGRSAEEEYKPNLHKIGQEIKGQRGLLFSNKSTEEVLSWFRSYSEGDYARSGNVSTEDVRLPAGPLPMFSHSLEPYLRQLGLPTSLVKGEIHLVKDHEVCKAGDTLTPESAKILKLLGYEMAEFHLTIECMWSHDGSFMKFTDSINTDFKENIKKEKKNSINKKATAISECPDEDMIMEVMEVELDKNSNELEKMSPESEKNSNELEDNSDELSDDDEFFGKTEESSAPLTIVSNTPITTTSTPKAKIEGFEKSHEAQENKTKEIVDIDENQVSDVLEVDNPSTRNSRPVTKSARKSKTVKKNSLPKTPDANISQDSPVFRQLRNRSVKVSRKRK